MKSRPTTEIPARFVLAGVEWSVHEVEHLEPMGQCDMERATILLRASLLPGVKVQTFYHELLHALFFTAGYTDHDERQIDAVGNLLHQFITTHQVR